MFQVWRSRLQVNFNFNDSPDYRQSYKIILKQHAPDQCYEYYVLCLYSLWKQKININIHQHGWHGDKDTVSHIISKQNGCGKYRGRFVTKKFDIFNFFSLVFLAFFPDHTKKQLISITCLYVKSVSQKATESRTEVRLRYVETKGFQ